MLLLLVLAVGLVHPSMALRNVMAYGNKCYESRPETVNFNTALANSATKVGPVTHSLANSHAIMLEPEPVFMRYYCIRLYLTHMLLRYAAIPRAILRR